MNDRPYRPNDIEKLSALIDGELGAAETAELTARLEREPALAAELERLRAADQRVRRALGNLADEPLPAGILSSVKNDGEEPVADDESNVVPLRRVDPAPRSRWPAALAAGLALAIGYLSANLLHTPAPAALPYVAGDGGVAPGSPLHALLQTRPSADPADLSPAGTAEARFSFRDGDGRWCRQAALTDAGAQVEFVACRTDGGWKVEFAAFAAAQTGMPGTYAPATGSATVVDGAVDALLRGEPLGRAEERRMIERGWEAD